MVPNFLPKPEDLVLKDESVTLRPSKESIDFLKQHTEKQGFFLA